MSCTASCAQGFSPRLAQCLSSLDVSCDGDINVECQPELPEQAEPLCNALQTLKGLRIRSKDTVVYLRDWDWPQLQVRLLCYRPHTHTPRTTHALGTLVTVQYSTVQYSTVQYSEVALLHLP